MPFLTYLDARALPCGKRWRLLAPLIYEYQTGELPDDPSLLVTVPAGFVSDLASIPRLMTPLLPVNDGHRSAAVIHDYLYATQTMPRATADRIFRAAMRDHWVPGWKSSLMWAGVRAFGWLAWRRSASK